VTEPGSPSGNPWLWFAGASLLLLTRRRKRRA
jgi:MYXO-CTERM domain-containing protein